LRQQGVNFNTDWLFKKINDYHIKDFDKKILHRIEDISEIATSPEFVNEITGFIPLQVQERTLKNQKFPLFLGNEIKEILKSAYHLLGC
jgi:hypothetical protein